jgi:hypothetical protein
VEHASPQYRSLLRFEFHSLIPGPTPGLSEVDLLRPENGGTSDGLDCLMCMSLKRQRRERIW